MKNLWAGIDLGLQTAAIAFLRGGTAAPWTLESVDILALPSGSVEERLDRYRNWLKMQMRKVSPHEIEGVFIEKPFVGKNIRSALLLGTLQGVTWALLKEAEWPALELLEPVRVKKALTGRGSASKAQVAAWLAHYLVPHTPLPPNHHATDAIAIAIAGALSQNSAITRTFTSRAER